MSSATPTVPVSLPAALDEWERLARAAQRAREKLVEHGNNCDSCRAAIRDTEKALHAMLTPWRILGLIGDARRYQKLRPRLFLDGDRGYPDYICLGYNEVPPGVYTGRPIDEAVDAAVITEVRAPAPEERDDAC